ncbi:MAG: hypothetical protein ACYC9S_05680 [Leptospirales bacterium]
MIETAIHPFFVHFLIAAGGLFLLSLVPGRIFEALSSMLRPLSFLLLFLFPVVLLSGLLARATLVRHHVAGDIRLLSIHGWMALLTVAVWLPMLVFTAGAGRVGANAQRRVWYRHPGWWVMAAMAIVLTATLGGELVYGRHGFTFPVR